MTEEEAGFDPTMKKKKKKKPFDPSALEGASEGVMAPAAGEDGTESGVVKDSRSTLAKEDDDEITDFTKIKKKKKKTTFNLNDLNDSLPSMGDSVAESGSTVARETPASAPAAIIDGDDDLDFNNMKKKKKKKKTTLALDDAVEDGEAGADDLGDGNELGLGKDGTAPGSGDAWRGSDRDYTYDELLQRVFNIMREKNPDMVAGEKRKFVMKPPQVLRVGTKKTSFANFLEISKTLRRTSKHLQAFLLAELGTSGSVDANNQLIIKGRFQQKQIENILRRYIKEYVTCHTCRAPETILEKDTRLNFLRCEKCGSRCSVQSIKSGFQAVTAKRAAIRAKAT